MIQLLKSILIQMIHEIKRDDIKCIFATHLSSQHSTNWSRFDNLLEGGLASDWLIHIT